jgi:anti-anti-sigma regulatory factor
MRFALWLPSPLRRLAEVVDRFKRQLRSRESAPTLVSITPHAPARQRPEPELKLEVEIRDTREGVVVRLGGEARVMEAGPLASYLSRLGARRPACVTFDLSALVHLSSLAMGVLTAYRRGAVRAGARVCLAPHLQPAVREALERAEVMELFESTHRAEPGVRPCPCVESAPTRYPNVSAVQQSCGVTWGTLVELEPQLQVLLWRARGTSANCQNSADVDRVFHRLRKELAELIGFAGKHYQHPILGSAGAYQVAYWKLYNAVAALVPDCTGGAKRALETQSSLDS